MKPRARIVGMATAGVAPRIMGFGPAPVTRKVLVLTALNQLEVIKGKYALCTMCIGVGQGIALIIERV